MFEDELKEMYVEAKKLAMEEFGKVAVGEVQRQFLIELKDKIKHKYNQLRIENEKHAEVSIIDINGKSYLLMHITKNQIIIIN